MNKRSDARKSAERPSAGRSRKVDAATQRAAREIEEDATSANTTRSEIAALRYWTEWHRLRFGGAELPRPVPMNVVMKFIVDHGLRKSRKEPGVLKNELPKSVELALVRKGVKKPGAPSLATILQRVSLIARVNRRYLKSGQRNPASEPEVRNLLSQLRNAYEKRSDADPDQRAALTFEPLGQLLAVLAEDLADQTNKWKYRRALRDRALLLFAFSTGGRRRSEVTGAAVKRLTQLPSGNYTYKLGATKSDRGKVDRQKKLKPLFNDAAEAMTAWLNEAEIDSGPIFRHITRKGSIAKDALTPASVRNLVKRLAAAAGIDEQYSAHSLRSGYLTEAFSQGIPLPEAMALSGHKSVASAVRYYRIGNVEDSPAASLADGITKMRLPSQRRRSTATRTRGKAG